MDADSDPVDRLFVAAWTLSIEGMRQALEDGARHAHRDKLSKLMYELVAMDKPTLASPADVGAALLEALRLLESFGCLLPEQAMRHALTCSRDCAVVVYLLGLGVDATNADPDFGEVAGASWLHFARTPAAARLLIAAGANATAATACGATPLHLVISELPYCDRGVMRVLVEAGADADATNTDGETPLDWALEGAENTDLVADVTALLDVGADPGRRMSVQQYVALMIDVRLAHFVRFRRERRYKADFDIDVLVALLTAAAAWHRRRHALCAIRGRYADRE